MYKENASSWGNYMRVVAQLLVNDATALYDDWAVKYNTAGYRTHAGQQLPEILKKLSGCLYRPDGYGNQLG